MGRFGCGVWFVASGEGGGVAVVEGAAEFAAPGAAGGFDVTRAEAQRRSDGAGRDARPGSGEREPLHTGDNRGVGAPLTRVGSRCLVEGDDAGPVALMPPLKGAQADAGVAGEHRERDLVFDM